MKIAFKYLLSFVSILVWQPAISQIATISSTGQNPTATEAKNIIEVNQNVPGEASLVVTHFTNNSSSKLFRYDDAGNILWQIDLTNAPNKSIEYEKVMLLNDGTPTEDYILIGTLTDHSIMNAQNKHLSIAHISVVGATPALIWERSYSYTEPVSLINKDLKAVDFELVPGTCPSNCEILVVANIVDPNTPSPRDAIYLMSFNNLTNVGGPTLTQQNAISWANSSSQIELEALDMAEWKTGYFILAALQDDIASGFTGDGLVFFEVDYVNYGGLITGSATPVFNLPTAEGTVLNGQHFKLKTNNWINTWRVDLAFDKISDPTGIKAIYKFRLEEDLYNSAGDIQFTVLNEDKFYILGEDLELGNFDRNYNFNWFAGVRNTNEFMMIDEQRLEIKTYPSLTRASDIRQKGSSFFLNAEINSMGQFEPAFVKTDLALDIDKSLPCLSTESVNRQALTWLRESMTEHRYFQGGPALYNSIISSGVFTPTPNALCQHPCNGMQPFTIVSHLTNRSTACVSGVGTKPLNVTVNLSVPGNYTVKVHGPGASGSITINNGVTGTVSFAGNRLKPILPGTYWITVTDQAGCYESATFTLTALTDPYVDKLVVCPSTSIGTQDGEIHLEINPSFPLSTSPPTFLVATARGITTTYSNAALQSSPRKITIPNMYSSTTATRIRGKDAYAHLYEIEVFEGDEGCYSYSYAYVPAIPDLITTSQSALGCGPGNSTASMNFDLSDRFAMDKNYQPHTSMWMGSYDDISYMSIGTSTSPIPPTVSDLNGSAPLNWTNVGGLGNSYTMTYDPVTYNSGITGWNNYSSDEFVTSPNHWEKLWYNTGGAPPQNNINALSFGVELNASQCTHIDYILDRYPVVTSSSSNQMASSDIYWDFDKSQSIRKICPDVGTNYGDVEIEFDATHWNIPSSFSSQLNRADAEKYIKEQNINITYALTSGYTINYYEYNSGSGWPATPTLTKSVAANPWGPKAVTHILWQFTPLSPAGTDIRIEIIPNEYLCSKLYKDFQLPGLAQLAYTQTDEYDCAANLGSITPTITGGTPPYSYQWGPVNQTTRKLTRVPYLAAGYNLTVTDANGCTLTQSGLGFQNTVSSITNVTATANPPCEIQVSWSGGTAPYTIVFYRLNPNTSNYEYVSTDVTTSTSLTSQGFPEGDYRIFVIDANKCEGVTATDVTLTDGSTPTYEFCVQFLNPMNTPIEPDDPVIETEEERVKRVFVENMFRAVGGCVLQVTGEVSAIVRNTCLNPGNVDDKLNIKQGLKQSQHMLYFFDRAGNLTKTVPPEGIDLIHDIGEDKDATGATNRKQYGGVANGEGYSTKYSHNGLHWVQKTESVDGGQTNFLYNRLGLVRFSQTAQQKQDCEVSYFKYDELGRTRETGVISECALSTIKAAGNVDQTYTGSVVDLNATYPGNSIGKTEIIYVEYSNINSSYSYYGQPQRFTNNRISYVYCDFDGVSNSGDEVYTIYSYDPHGNAEWLIQDLPGLGRNYIHYEYDLISSSVKLVAYNEYEDDAFFHRYWYDEDNRIALVETSHDQITWEKDAGYEYYQHGPLARVEIGEHNLQGIDFTYTISGWLKALNQPNRKGNGGNGYDPGGDGSSNTDFLSDAFAMSLGYHSNDFKHSYFESNSTNSDFLNDYGNYDLYNGNISSVAFSHEQGDASGLLADKDAMVASYRYDQVNRIKESTTKGLNTNTGDIDASSNQFFATSYEYDRNGNLTGLNRQYANGNNPTAMDDLTYFYLSETNQLDYVKDGDGAVLNTSGCVISPNDLNDQSSGNYTYDKSGNLIQDLSNDILLITWNSSGKVREIKPVERPGVCQKPAVRFTYDANGNRVIKEVDTEPWDGGNYVAFTVNGENYTEIYYVLDANGNAMGVYNKTYNINANSANLILEEQSIYGSDRVGQRVPNSNSKAKLDNRVQIGNEFKDYSTSKFISTNASTWAVTTASNKVVKHNNSSAAHAIETIPNIENTKTLFVAENKEGETQFLAFTKGSGNTSILHFYFYNVLTNSYDPVTQKGSTTNHTVSNVYAEGDVVGIKNSTDNTYFVFFIKDVSGNRNLGWCQIDMNTGEALDAMSNSSFVNTLSYLNSGNLGLALYGFESEISGTISQLYFTEINSGAVDVKHFSVASNYLSSWANLSTVATSATNLFSVTGTWGGHGKFSVHHKGLFLAYMGESNASTTTSTLKILPFSPTTLYTGSSPVLTVSGITHTNITDINLEFGYGNYLYYTSSAGSNVYDVSGTMNPNPRALSLTNWGSGQYKRDRLGNLIRIDYNSGTGNTSLYQLSDWASLPTSNSFSVGTPYVVSGVTLSSGVLGDRTAKLVPSYSPSNENLSTQLSQERQYEIKDHLGNVRSVLGGLRLYNTKMASSLIVHPDPNILSFTDYYPFGMMMPGRNENPGTYRYGFQGQEEDDEIKGSGNSINYKYRMHDPRVGRFFAIDPLAPEYPWNSPYAFSENRVIASVELEGLEAHDLNDGTTVYGPWSHETLNAMEGKDKSVMINYEVSYEMTEGRNSEGLIAPVIASRKADITDFKITNDGKGEEWITMEVTYQTKWSPWVRDGYWTTTTLVGTDYKMMLDFADQLASNNCKWCEDAQLDMNESVLIFSGVSAMPIPLTVDNIVKYPWILRGVNQKQFEKMIAGGLPKGWRAGQLTQGSGKGTGIKLTLYKGDNPTSIYIRFHPGSLYKRKDGRAYYRVSNGKEKSPVIYAD